MLPTKLRCESEDDADEDEGDEGVLVLGVALGCWLSGVVGDWDGVAEGCVLGSCEVVLWANAAGSIVRARTAIRIKLIRFIVATLHLGNCDYVRRHFYCTECANGFLNE